MIRAIVYTSNAGTTREYANLLGEATGLPVYSFEESTAALQKKDAVIYLGWVMAGKIQGYANASKRYSIQAVCGVCMGATGSQIPEIRTKNHIAADMPTFTMQGGFDINHLHGVYKVMMTVMVKTAGKRLSDKTDRTPEEDVMLDMMLHGRNCVSKENMSEVLAWYSTL